MIKSSAKSNLDNLLLKLVTKKSSQMGFTHRKFDSHYGVSTNDVTLEGKGGGTKIVIFGDLKA